MQTQKNVLLNRGLTMIKVTREILEKQALLIQQLTIREDENTGGEIRMMMESCYELIAETYGFNSYEEMKNELRKQDN